MSDLPMHHPDDEAIVRTNRTHRGPPTKWVRTHEKQDWLPITTDKGVIYYQFYMTCAAGEYLYIRRTKLEAMQAGFIYDPYKQTGDD